MVSLLASQLQKRAQSSTALAAASATGLASKREASILFADPKVAADKDREAIFHIGCNGLMELVQWNPSTFSPYAQSLFSEALKNYDPALHTKEENAKLDALICDFLGDCSPYLIRCTNGVLKCLEWLIRRFQIHNRNVEALIRLILPVHQSTIWTKVCAVIDFSRHPKWAFIQGTKPNKHNKALTRQTLLQELGKRTDLLETVLQYLIEWETGESIPFLEGFLTSTLGAFLVHLSTEDKSTSLRLIISACFSALDCPLLPPAEQLKGENAMPQQRIALLLLGVVGAKPFLFEPAPASDLLRHILLGLQDTSPALSSFTVAVLLTFLRSQPHLKAQTETWADMIAERLNTLSEPTALFHDVSQQTDILPVLTLLLTTEKLHPRTDLFTLLEWNGVGQEGAADLLVTCYNSAQRKPLSSARVQNLARIWHLVETMHPQTSLNVIRKHGMDVALLEKNTFSAHAVSSEAISDRSSFVADGGEDVIMEEGSSFDTTLDSSVSFRLGLYSPHASVRAQALKDALITTRFADETMLALLQSDDSPEIIDTMMTLDHALFWTTLKAMGLHLLERWARSHPAVMASSLVTSIYLWQACSIEDIENTMGPLFLAILLYGSEEQQAQLKESWQQHGQGSLFTSTGDAPMYDQIVVHAVAQPSAIQRLLTKLNTATFEVATFLLSVSHMAPSCLSPASLMSLSKAVTVPTVPTYASTTACDHLNIPHAAQVALIACERDDLNRASFRAILEAIPLGAGCTKKVSRKKEAKRSANDPEDEALEKAVTNLSDRALKRLFHALFDTFLVTFRIPRWLDLMLTSPVVIAKINGSMVHEAVVLLAGGWSSLPSTANLEDAHSVLYALLQSALAEKASLSESVIACFKKLRHHLKHAEPTKIDPFFFRKTIAQQASQCWRPMDQPVASLGALAVAAALSGDAAKHTTIAAAIVSALPSPTVSMICHLAAQRSPGSLPTPSTSTEAMSLAQRFVAHVPSAAFAQSVCRLFFTKEILTKTPGALEPSLKWLDMLIQHDPEGIWLECMLQETASTMFLGMTAAQASLWYRRCISTVLFRLPAIDAARRETLLALVASLILSPNSVNHLLTHYASFLSRSSQNSKHGGIGKKRHRHEDHQETTVQEKDNAEVDHNSTKQKQDADREEADEEREDAVRGTKPDETKMGREKREDQLIFSQILLWLPGMLRRMRGTEKVVPTLCRLLETLHPLDQPSTSQASIGREGHQEAQFYQQCIVQTIREVLQSYTLLSGSRQGVHGSGGGMQGAQAVSVTSIVQTLRQTTNQQTENQCLRILSLIAQLQPERMGEAIMPIFSFMGSRTVRKDDDQSYALINKTLDSVLVAFAKVHDERATQQRFMTICQTLLQSFTHVPEHRRIPLFTKVSTLLGQGPASSGGTKHGAALRGGGGGGGVDATKDGKGPLLLTLIVAGRCARGGASAMKRPLELMMAQVLLANGPSIALSTILTILEIFFANPSFSATSPTSANLDGVRQKSTEAQDMLRAVFSVSKENSRIDEMQLLGVLAAIASETWLLLLPFLEDASRQHSSSAASSSSSFIHVKAQRRMDGLRSAIQAALQENALSRVITLTPTATTTTPTTITSSKTLQPSTSSSSSSLSTASSSAWTHAARRECQRFSTLLLQTSPVASIVRQITALASSSLSTPLDTALLAFVKNKLEATAVPTATAEASSTSEQAVDQPALSTMTNAILKALARLNQDGDAAQETEREKRITSYLELSRSMIRLRCNRSELSVADANRYASYLMPYLAAKTTSLSRHIVLLDTFIPLIRTGGAGFVAHLTAFCGAAMDIFMLLIAPPCPGTGSDAPEISQTKRMQGLKAYCAAWKQLLDSQSKFLAPYLPRFMSLLFMAMDDAERLSVSGSHFMQKETAYLLDKIVLVIGTKRAFALLSTMEPPLSSASSSPAALSSSSSSNAIQVTSRAAYHVYHHVFVAALLRGMTRQDISDVRKEWTALCMRDIQRFALCDASASDGNEAVVAGAVDTRVTAIFDNFITVIAALNDVTFRPVFDAMIQPFKDHTDATDSGCRTMTTRKNNLALPLHFYMTFFIDHLLLKMKGLIVTYVMGALPTLLLPPAETQNPWSLAIQKLQLNTLQQILETASDEQMTKDVLDQITRVLQDGFAEAILPLDTLLLTFVRYCKEHELRQRCNEILHGLLPYCATVSTTAALSLQSRALDLLFVVLDGLGDSTSQYIAEMIPTLAQIMEDDNDEAEEKARNCLKKMEDLTGEDMQAYL